MPLHKNQILPLQIDSISSDGSGVGRHDGKVIFVGAPLWATFCRCKY